MLRPQPTVQRREFQIVRSAKVSSQFEVIDGQDHPCHGATSLDDRRRVGISGGLFAGAEASGVSPVPAANAAPMMHEGAPVLVLA